MDDPDGATYNAFVIEITDAHAASTHHPNDGPQDCPAGLHRLRARTHGRSTPPTANERCIATRACPDAP